MRHTTVALTILAAVSTALALATVDISGKWTALVETPMGQVNYTYTFVVKDATLSGTIESSMGKIDGKVEGEKVTFVENLTFDDMRYESPIQDKSPLPTRSSSHATLATLLRNSW